MKSLLPSACAVGALGVLSVVAEVCMGSFPLDIFRFPLNVVLLALWFATISMLYRNRSGNAFARFML